LRNNRVLHPARWIDKYRVRSISYLDNGKMWVWFVDFTRNAQIFSTLINAMLMNGMWSTARDVVDYVGLTKLRYCSFLPTNPNFQVEKRPCTNSITMTFDDMINYVSRRMLELDLDRMKWINQRTFKRIWSNAIKSLSFW
jgi:hypothetical protein